MPDDISNPVDQWNKKSEELLWAVQDLLSNAHTKEEQAEILVAVDYLRYEVNEIYKQLVTLVTDKMGEEPEMAVKDGVTLEKKTGAPRKQWDHKGLAEEVARRVIMTSVDMDTGEMTKSTEEMLTEMLNYAAPSYWRVKNLSEIGIVADDYCELGEPKASVIIRRDT